MGRHGDRRPKEKMKFKSKHPMILSYFDDVEDEADVAPDKERERKLKTPEELDGLKTTMETIAKELREQIQVVEVELAQPKEPGEAKESKEPKEGKEAKVAKEAKEPKEGKETKEAKEPKEGKET